MIARRGYGKFPLVGFQDLYKTDLQNSFRVIRIILRGVPGIVTQTVYHWTLLRGGPRARVPSIILCVKKWSPRAPQRGGSSHSGEGQNGGSQLIKVERSRYNKIPVVEFEDIYKTDLQNSFRVNRIILCGVLALVTQILSWIWGFSLKVPGAILGFMPTSHELKTPLLIMQVSYVWVSNRVNLAE